MNPLLKAFLILTALIIVAYAYREDGKEYNPVKEGMPHNTSGEEWDTRKEKLTHPKIIRE